MKLLAILLMAACLARGLSAAPITAGALPDETVLLDSSDPFGLGYKFTMSGVDYYWTNQPTVVEKDLTALMALGASNTVYVGWFQGLWSKSNDWNTAFGWGNWAGPVASNTAAIAVLQTNTLTRADGLAYVTKEAFSTNRVTRWYDPESPTRWAEWDGGTNIVIYKAEVSGTNLQVTLSSDFEETATHTRPSWTTTNWPFTDGDWVAETYPDGFVAIKAYLVEYSSWGGNVNTLPAVLTPDSFAQGTATVSIASFNLTTNVEYRYFLPTNAIPPELSNLDALQGWLNNLYAGKGDFDAHAPPGTIATPHLIEGDRALIDSIPSKAPASVTNAPVWLIYSNIVSAVTVTNQAERPVRIYGTGANTGLVSFASLREPLPVFFEASQFGAVQFPGAYVVGGGTWQTNMVNLFIAFRSGTNDFVTPITTREP